MLAIPAEREVLFSLSFDEGLTIEIILNTDEAIPVIKILAQVRKSKLSRSQTFKIAR